MIWKCVFCLVSSIILAGASSGNAQQEIFSDGVDSGPASRSFGVAPLGVFFDAVAVPVILLPPLVNARREYADYHLEWNFDDASCESRAPGGKPRNEAQGYVAAHVFEEPGTYQAILKITDQAGHSENHQEQIRFLSPSQVYVRSSTACVFNDADFSGYPVGAQYLITDDFFEIRDFLGPSEWILLRHGDKWTTSAGIYISDNPGPTTIGAFGECLDPDERGICANTPLIEDASGIVEQLLVLFRASDFRLLDLRFHENLDPSSVVGGVTDLASILHLHLRIRGFTNPMVTCHWLTDGHDQCTYVDNDISNNICGGSGPWQMAIGPQVAQEDEHLSDILVEKTAFFQAMGRCKIPCRFVS